MLEGLLAFVASWTINLISYFGYLGIFTAMAIESASIPLPSEIIMPFSGFLVSQGKLSFFLVILSGALGNLFGSILMYGLGYYGEAVLVKKFVRGWGRILINESELARGEKWFRKYGEIIVFISRIFPVIRTFISIPAGIARVNFTRFCILTFIGSFIWSSLLTYIGLKLGENWSILEPTFRRFDIFIVTAGIIMIGVYLFSRLKHLRGLKNSNY